MGAEGPECWAERRRRPNPGIQLDAYWIDRCCVTNSEFETFVEETGYLTEAETFGWSIVFMGQIPKAQRKRKRFETVVGMHWWAKVEKADWRKPGGPGTNVRKLGEHPVVHASWNDASAYAEWAGKTSPPKLNGKKRLAEGLDQKRYPWGTRFCQRESTVQHLAREVPRQEHGEDGHLWTAPAKSFPGNDFGLHNSSGTAWEWTSDSFHPTWRQTADAKNPTGPQEGTEKVIKEALFCVTIPIATATGWVPGRETRLTRRPRIRASALPAGKIEKEDHFLRQAAVRMNRTLCAPQSFETLHPR